MTFQALNRQNKRATNAAGARYTPGIEPGAPNLQLRSVVEAVDAVSFAPNVRTAIEHVQTALEISWRDASTELKTSLRRWRFGPAALATTLKQLESCTVGQAPRLAVQSRSIATRLQRHLDKRLRDLFQKEAAEKDSNLKSRLAYERHDTQKFLSASEDVTAALSALTEPLQRQV